MSTRSSPTRPTDRPRPRHRLALHFSGVNGVLADDMGLGKTVQIIAYLTQLLEWHITDSAALDSSAEILSANRYPVAPMMVESPASLSGAAAQEESSMSLLLHAQGAATFGARMAFISRAISLAEDSAANWGLGIGFHVSCGAFRAERPEEAGANFTGAGFCRAASHHCPCDGR